MSYLVGQGTREMGIRRALGASPGSVAGAHRETRRDSRLILGVIGLAIGLAGSLLLGRLLSRTVRGISAADPLSCALALLFAVSAMASALPAFSPPQGPCRAVR